MDVFLSILLVIVAIFLVLIVIVQNSKGGGLAAGFASGNQTLGVRKTTDFLEKATWWLAGSLVVISIATTIFAHPKNIVSDDSIIKDDIIETTTKQDANALPPAFDQTFPVQNEAPTE
ncbi:MAG: preprotein translocase subunit SecG [Candidatus Symbiothrix sp.]|jgi:preprotein translocase subunit SecG|nr:preprotein translocase subunit SecG [Candidatus Symbiothrix sp.]